MDKYEFKLSLDEINRLIQERRFEEAADIADTIDWNHVKSAQTLGRVSEVYKIVGDYVKSRDIMAIAYRREPGNPSILYSLCDLTIYLYGHGGLQTDLTTAMQLLQEYQTVEPHNPRRLILQYKFYDVSSVTDGEKIAVLEQLRREQFSARWGYELAALYARTGDTAKAAGLCTEVYEIFGGRYGDRAVQLRESLRGQDVTPDAGPSAVPADREKVPAPAPAPADREASPAAAQARADSEPAAPSAPDTADRETAQAGAACTTQENGARQDGTAAADAFPAGDENLLPPEDLGGPAPADETAQESINEVMAEWERIRADIRRANDEKRARRILEDTGSLLQTFEETARHGLLEDIEKGVARQRRQVRSGVYRMTDSAPEDYAAPRARQTAAAPAREERAYEGSVHEGSAYEGPAYEGPACEEPAQEEPAGVEPAYEETGASYEEPAVPAERQEQPGGPKEPSAPVSPLPVSNEDDDVKIYGQSSRIDDVATRRWNPEEVHRTMAQEEQRIREEEARLARERAAQEGPAEPGRQEEPPQLRPQEEVMRDETAVTAGAPDRNRSADEPVRGADDDHLAEGQEVSLQAPGEERAGEAPAEMPADGQAQNGGQVQTGGRAQEPGGRRALSREERQLFGPFCRMEDNVRQLTEALEQISLASSTGNLLILGNEATADRVAKGILEIIRRSDANFTGRVARANGESLNRLDAKGFSRTFEKLQNGALIITKGADIAPKAMKRLSEELEGRDRGVILIMTDVARRMDSFRRDNAAYMSSFTAVINIRPLDDKALVAYARDYAVSKDYSIDEFGQLALAQRISSMQTTAHHVTLQEVREIVDEAIGYASKKNPHMLMEIISRKRYDEDDRIILHENDFTHY